MMGGRFTKTIISLILKLVHKCLICHLKCMIVIDLTYIKGLFNLKPNFSLYFLIQDFSLNMALILMKLYKHVANIHLGGTVSQIFYLGLSFSFI